MTLISSQTNAGDGEFKPGDRIHPLCACHVNDFGTIENFSAHDTIAGRKADTVTVWLDCGERITLLRSDVERAP